MAISTCWRSIAWRRASCISTTRSATGRGRSPRRRPRSCGSTDAGTLAAGGAADFVIFKGRSWTELLSRPESDRIVVRDGRAIDRELARLCRTRRSDGEDDGPCGAEARSRRPEDRGQSGDRPAEEPRLLLVQPGAEARARPCDRRSGRLAEERGRGDPRARRLSPAWRSGDAARHRHRQLRPGHAAVRRRRAQPRRDERGHDDRARPGRLRAGRDSRRHRQGDARPFRPGTEAAPVHLQHGLDRRLHRRRLWRRRLDQFRRPARFRQCHPAARRDHGGGAPRRWISPARTCTRSPTPTAPTASSPRSRCR